MHMSLNIFSKEIIEQLSLEINEEENIIYSIIFGQEKSFTGNDLFDALCAMREYLEITGFVVCCNGSRLRFYPSGMSRNMSGGLVGYMLTKGQAATRDDLARTFDHYLGDDLVSVEQQKSFFRDWLTSL